MSEALIVSNIILWIAVLLLAILLFALTRQVGILHERVAPAGALQPTTGPKIGEVTEGIQTKSLQGESIQIGGSEKVEFSSFVLLSIDIFYL